MATEDDIDESWLNLESVDHVLSTTRSVRKMLDLERPISAELLYDCINIATQAPTGIPGENWRFVIVTDADKKLQLAELYRSTIAEFQQQHELQIKPTQKTLMSHLQDVPAMIFVCATGAQPGPESASQVGFYASILPAAWSLMLALRSRRIGSTWTALLASRQQEVADILGMDDDVVQTVMLPVAHMKGAVLRKARRRDARELTYWNQWGQTDA